MKRDNKGGGLPDLSLRRPSICTLSCSAAFFAAATLSAIAVGDCLSLQTVLFKCEFLEGRDFVGSLRKHVTNRVYYDYPLDVMYAFRLPHMPLRRSCSSAHLDLVSLTLRIKSKSV